MIKYLIERITISLIALFIILTLAFCILRMMPGGAYDSIDVAPEVAEMLQTKDQLDRPVLVQYAYFLKGLVTGAGWGYSNRVEPGVPVFDVLKKRMPVSLSLNLMSLALALPVGCGLGLAAALERGGASELASFSAIIWVSVPSFVLAALLQYVFAYKLKLFPILYQPSGTLSEKLQSMALPTMALAAGPVATLSRYLSGEMREVLSADYMKYAEAKGLGRYRAALTHGMKNAAIPLISVFATIFASILGGSLVIERMFSIPGAGGIMITSINARDYNLTVASLVFYAAMSVVSVMLADICYGFVDPRVRVGGTR